MLFSSGHYHLYSYWECTNFFFSTFSLTLVIACIFYNHPNGCEVIIHCDFDLHFPDEYWWWAPFHVPVGNLYIFFEKLSIQVLCPLYIWIIYYLLVVVFFFLLLSCPTFLYIFIIHPLLYIWIWHQKNKQ